MRFHPLGGAVREKAVSRVPGPRRSTVPLHAYAGLPDMRKQARKLWLGDWQRGDEEPPVTHAIGADSDQGDTVVVRPDDDGVREARAEDRTNVRRGIASAAAIAVLCALGFVVLSGGDDSRLSSARPQVPPAQTPQTQPPQSQVPQTPQRPQGTAPPGFGGPDLTGPEAAKAAKAAVARYPGDVERVTAGPGGGGYVVHVFQPDGNEVHVVVSDKFKVLGSDAGGGPRGFGGGAPSPGAAPPGGSTNQS